MEWPTAESKVQIHIVDFRDMTPWSGYMRTEISDLLGVTTQKATIHISTAGESL
jgi:hypothetical protein